jgi:G3E family GTPase
VSKRPVTVVGGFLGSGKTTLLRRALSGGASGVAAVVNEFGEVGLDHHLVEEVAEQTVVLAGGCACCQRRADLVQALRRLLDQDQRGAIPRLRRVVIETSGLADPAPVLFTIATDPVLQHHFQVDRIAVTVDGLNGHLHLDRHPESVKQVMVADEIAVTKVDLAERRQVARLVERLRALNPSAGVRESVLGEGAAELVLGGSTSRPGPAPGGGRDLEGAHVAGTGSLSLDFDGPLDWVAFSVWLSLLLHAHGEEVLRVKGLLDVEGVGVVAINGVQHVIHAPEHVAMPPEGIGRSKLVLITRGVDLSLVERSLHAFQRAAGGRSAAGVA